MTARDTWRPAMSVPTTPSPGTSTRALTRGTGLEKSLRLARRQWGSQGADAGPRVSGEGIALRDHRFDNVVRALAEPASRRGALRGTVAVVATLLGLMRGGETAARHARIPLGGACYHTNQCLHHAVATRRARLRPSRQAVYCADNGFRYDGVLNCCRYGGGYCKRDEHCCGSRHFCRGGVCRYLR